MKVIPLKPKAAVGKPKSKGAAVATGTDDVRGAFKEPATLSAETPMAADGWSERNTGEPSAPELGAARRSANVRWAKGAPKEK